jgi:hypothetical protein
MAKPATIPKVLPLLAVLLAGCDSLPLPSFNSRESFYTDEVRAPASELRGEWWGDEQTLLFTGDSTMALRIYTDTGYHDFGVMPSKVAGVTFLDTVGGPNHLHGLLAADRQGRTLRLMTRDVEYAIARGVAHLPPPQSKAVSNPRPRSNPLVFTAGSAEWVQFLQHHATNTNAFRPSWALRKSPNANFVPAHRQHP